MTAYESPEQLVARKCQDNLDAQWRSLIPFALILGFFAGLLTALLTAILIGVLHG
jgi:hypothetical protein